MLKTLDNLFKIRDTINASQEPLTALEVSEITGMKVRSMQRYLMRLATEGLISFKGNNRGNVGGSGYIYARLGYWD